MKSSFRKKMKNFFFNKKSIVILSLLFIFIVVFCLYLFRKNIDEIKISEHDLYQYLNGLKVEYTGEIKISQDDDNISNLKIKDEIVELDSNPIYFKDEKKVLFPSNMSIIFPMHGSQNKINYYSTIYSDVGDIYIKDRGLNKLINNSIIYDGNDIYVLTDKSRLIFDDERIELSPLSFVICDDRNKVMFVYDYENDKIKEFNDFKNDVFIETDNYKINASLDLMYYNNKSRLFIKNIDILNNLENN